MLLPPPHTHTQNHVWTPIELTIIELEYGRIIPDSTFGPLFQHANIIEMKDFRDFFKYGILILSDYCFSFTC